MENVWNYPRPPAVEPCTRRVRVELHGVVLADSEHALRVLETSHPPAIYVPPQHVHGLVASRARSTWCEFKGTARYFDAATGERAVAWTYPDPSPGYEALRDFVSFYPGRVDHAWLGRRAGRRPGGRLLRRLDHGGHRRAVQGGAGHAGLVEAVACSSPASS